jgi:hypothetical protein
MTSTAINTWLYLRLPPIIAFLRKTTVMTTTKVLEEVNVSARKRDEDLQQVPISITPFSSAQMQKHGFNSLDYIAAATAGFIYEGFSNSYEL